MKAKNSYKNIYKFLYEKFSKEEKFEISELASAAVLKESSLKVYIRNKLRDRFIYKSGDGVPRQEKFPRLSIGNFLDLTDSISPCNEGEFPQVYLRKFQPSTKTKNMKSSQLIDWKV